jgi:hypothetical protein
MSVREDIIKNLEGLPPEALDVLLTLAKELHKPESVSDVAANVLRRIVEPKKEISPEEFERILKSAPIDDEPLTEDDIKAIDEGMEAYRRGEYYTEAEVKKILGIDE